MSFSATSTLEKMNSRDKDFRYMATADLLAELNKEGFKLDADSEKKITSQVLKLLEDNSNQVQELAVKCLGPLSKKVKEQHVQDIVDTLCNHLLNDKKGGDELRDVASIGIRLVITETPAEPSTISSLIVRRLTPRLLSAISTPDKPEIVQYCLDALSDLLSKYGALMTPDAERILKVIQPQLASSRATARKRAINCLEYLSVTLPDNQFTELVRSLLTVIKEAPKAEKMKTYIQAIGAISRSVGYKLGKFLSEIGPLIMKLCNDPKYDQDDELRENCFQCLESLIYRCPKEISSFIPGILELCFKYIKYDPNYEGEEMETEEDEEEEEEEEEGEDDEGNYSDDDDMSWKVRRSSAKCISGIINTRPDLLQDMYSKVAPHLIARFKEREENVKLDIFATFVDLLRQTAFVSRKGTVAASFTVPLRELVPKIVQGITRQLKEKSVKTRSGAFSLLKELVIVLRGSLSEHVGSLVPGVLYSLGDRNTNSNLKIEALTFLRLLMSTHEPSIFHSHVKVLSAPIFKSIGDNYYRITAEALRVCCELVLVLRPENTTFNYKPFVADLFKATLEKLKAQDIDQEVKESAIRCTGLILAHLGDELKTETPAVLQILQDRLSNEITRLTAVKAFENIATSRLHLNITPVLGDTVKELASFLRKANRQLKQNSLITLTVIVKNYGTEKPAKDLFDTVLSELAPLISDSDLHLAHLALNLATTILHSHQSAVIGKDVLPRTMELIRSSLLQGSALESLLSLLSTLVSTGSTVASFDVLLSTLTGLVASSREPPSKQVILNISKGVAAVCLSARPDQRDATVSRYLSELGQLKDGTTSKHLNLYCIGEIGRGVDLSSHASLQKTVLQAFDSPNEETRQAASFCLGNVAVGSFEKYLPFLLDEIHKNPKIKYLLLHSLREVIVRQSGSPKGVDAMKSHQTSILPLLFGNSESDEEGTRNVVAECLGKLALLNPNDLLPEFTKRIGSGSAFTRSTLVTALKFAVTDKPQTLDQILLPLVGKFLELMKDKDLDVRRNALLTLNYIAHNKPILIREALPSYLPLVYEESKPKPELIREVDLGPFKHKVDDGLEIRKAAFECMYTLLDTCLDRVDIPSFIVNLVGGLKDHYDVKMLAHLMLVRLAAVSGPALLEGLDQLVEPLRQTLGSKPKESAVKQEVERNDELIRSALRAIYSITRIPNVETNHKFEEFLKQSIKTGEFAEKFAAIKAESEQAEGGVVDPMDLS